MVAKAAILCLVLLAAFSGAVSSAAPEDATCDASALHSYSSHYIGRPLVAIFDDGGQADIALLEYRWKLDSRTDEEDHISVSWNLTIPRRIEGLQGSIIYFGDAAAAAAEKGDFRFVKRFNVTDDQRAEAHITRKGDNPNTVPAVVIPGPFFAEGSANVTVSRFQNAIQSSDAPDIRWAMSVEPNAIPLGGNVNMTLLGAWPSGPVPGTLRVSRASDVPPSVAILRNLPDKERWIEWGTEWMAVSYGTTDAPRQIEQALAYAYETRCGVFVGTASGFYTDDLLLTKLGLLSYRGSPESVMVPDSLSSDAKHVPASPLSFVLPALVLAALACRRPH